MLFHPLVLSMMMVLVGSVLVLFFVMQIGIISYAFDKIGSPQRPCLACYCCHGWGPG